MKLHPNQRNGSVLLAILVTTGIIGISLASYMSLTSNQAQAVARSQAYSWIMPVVEAGLEEALTQINTTNTWSGNGWTMVNGLTLSNDVTLTGNQYIKQRHLADGWYTVALSESSPPTIVSQGYLVAPRTTNVISRTVRVTTTGGSLFSRGMVAKAGVNWNGNVVVDSFDSADPAYSINGRYDVSRRIDHGSVGAVNGSIAMGGGIIYGTSSTGPAGSCTGGTVGDSNYVSGGSSGIQPGHYESDLNLSFPDVQLPWSGGSWTPYGGTVSTTNVTVSGVPTTSLSAPSDVSYVQTNATSQTYPTGTTYPVSSNKHGSKWYYTYTIFEYSTNVYTTNVTTDTYTHILDTGDYKLSYISNGEKMLVRGLARLYVEGDIDMQGQSQITILQGANLQLYVGGDCNLSGNGVQNDTASALNFSLWGLPSCTSIRMHGNASFTGTIYAPQADFSAGGGGSTEYDCVGAVIVNSVTMNGHFLFHYDERVGRDGPRGIWAVGSWNEI